MGTEQFSIIYSVFPEPVAHVVASRSYPIVSPPISFHQGKNGVVRRKLITPRTLFLRAYRLKLTIWSGCRCESANVATGLRESSARRLAVVTLKMGRNREKSRRYIFLQICTFSTGAPKISAKSGGESQSRLSQYAQHYAILRRFLGGFRPVLSPLLR